MAVRNYQDLIAWQRAVALAEAVYAISMALPVEERYGLTSQMRRAAVSVPASIAEGQGRRTRGECSHQLSVAHGSLRELETHTIIAGRLHLLSDAAVDQLLSRTAEVGKPIQGLANALERQRAGDRGQ